MRNSNGLTNIFAELSERRIRIAKANNANIGKDNFKISI